MRHCDIRLTLDLYTDPTLIGLHKALDALPKFDASDPESLRATGTCDGPDGLVSGLVVDRSFPGISGASRDTETPQTTQDEADEERDENAVTDPSSRALNNANLTHFLQGRFL
jgi:hypothetical protein